jgi:phosphate uptake regulator
MKRKLVKQGAATMMISLPSKWVKSNKLEKGDEISLEEKNNELIINTEKISKEKSKVEIDISGLYPLINRTLISLYIKGIDEVEISFSDSKDIEDFKKRAINELLGFEIIKQSQKSIIVKDITGSERQEVDELIKRIFLILDSMAEELCSALEKKQDMQPITEIDASVNKFVNFCLRILNKRGYKELNKTSQIYGIVSMLEEIGDLYKKIAKEFQKNKKISKEQLSRLKEIREFLKMFENLFFNFREIRDFSEHPKNPTNKQEGFFDFDKKELINYAKKYEDIKKKIEQKGMIDFYLYSLNESIIKLSNYLLVSV